MMDAVIKACGSASEENCPIWPGMPMRQHRRDDDTAVAEEAERDSAFRPACTILMKRAEVFLAHSVQAVEAHELPLHLNRVGKVT